MLGDDSAEAVQGLVDQSLLSVGETPAGGRYRMLETVREFGRMRLADAGEEAAALAAQRRWAAAYARQHGARLAGRDQFAAIDALGAEEVNLADELRGALADGDRGALVQLLSALGLFWTRPRRARSARRAGRGGHRGTARLAAAARAGGCGARRGNDHAEQLADDQRPRTAASSARSCCGSGRTRRAAPELSGLMRVLLAYDPAEADPDVLVGRLERLADGEDRPTALAASQWLCHMRENAARRGGRDHRRQAHAGAVPRR